MQTKSLQKKRALRTALSILLLSTVGMTKGYAQNFDFSAVCPTGQTLYYKITDGTNHRVKLTCPGQADYYTCWEGFEKPTGDIVLSNNVYYNGMTYTISEIGDYAFYQCEGLTGSLIIPNSITTIGKCSFLGCNGFTGSLTIPFSVESIGRQSFCMCSNFNEIHFNAINCIDTTPAGMYHPFNSCSGVLIIGENVGKIPNNIFSGAAFSGNLIIPNSCVEIGAGAFGDCTGFTGDLTIPNSVTTIGNGAFIRCTGLSGSLFIPSSVTSIGEQAFGQCNGFDTVFYNASYCADCTNNNFPPFKDCNELGVLYIGENVRRIPKCLFYTARFSEVHFDAINCADATDQYYPNFSSCNGDLIIGNNVEIIPKGIFRSSHFSNIILPYSITEIKEDAFAAIGTSNVYYSGDVYHWCNIVFKNRNANPIANAHKLYINDNLVSDLIIPESITIIKEYSFAGASCLNSIALPNTLVSILPYAFDGCSGITTITIPRSVSRIHEYAFSSCGLTNVNYYADNCLDFYAYAFRYSPITVVNIGNNVQRIADYAFKDCSTLNTIIALGITPPTLGYNAFTGISPVATLFVPCGSLMAYFSSWNMFEYNNIHEDCTPRPISINPIITGGTIIPSVSQATMGQEVMLTVTPNPGMQLVSITAYNTNNPSQIVPVSPSGNFYRFIMPPYAVTVSATFETCTSLEEDSFITANVYPNPTNGHVKIETEDIRHIRINNMIGQVIYESVTTGNEFKYDLSKQGEGVYLVRIETSNGVVTKRVVVTR